MQQKKGRQATFQRNKRLQLADIVFIRLIYRNRLCTLVIFQRSFVEVGGCDSSRVLHQLNSVNRLLTGREAASLG